MSAKLNSDPHFARYQSTGAVISLEELLVQRHAAKNLDYLAHSRSIAGISGLHLSKMRGRGLDFEEFRPYQAGDDIRLIDWRVTARTNKPFTKVFREERERPSYHRGRPDSQHVFWQPGCLQVGPGSSGRRTSCAGLPSIMAIESAGWCFPTGTRPWFAPSAAADRRCIY